MEPNAEIWDHVHFGSVESDRIQMQNTTLFKYVVKAVWVKIKGAQVEQWT